MKRLLLSVVMAFFIGQASILVYFTIVKFAVDHEYSLLLPLGAWAYFMATVLVVPSLLLPALGLWFVLSVLIYVIWNWEVGRTQHN